MCAKTRLEISAAICTKILLTALFIPSIACIIVKYDEKPVNKKIALPAIRAYSLNARVLVTRQLSTIFTPIKVFLVCILDPWRCTTSVTVRSLQEAPSVKLYIRVFTPTILETKPFFVLFFFPWRGRKRGVTNISRGCRLGKHTTRENRFKPRHRLLRTCANWDATIVRHEFFFVFACC